MSAWIPDFLSYCEENNVPYDFVSTHEYPTDPPGPQSRTFFTSRLQETRTIVGDTIPLFYTEYDDGYNDATSYGAAFVIFQNYLANGIVDILSFWVFSDIFEEAGLYPDPYSTVSWNENGLANFLDTQHRVLCVKKVCQSIFIPEDMDASGWIDECVWNSKAKL